MKNIILITVDCFRYDRCSFNGHNRATTPYLDEIATDSFVFDNAYATGPYTTESFPGILAGKHSFNGSYYGDSVGWKALSGNDETIATYLKANGFCTIASLTNPHLVTDRNFDRGFDSFENLRTESTGSENSNAGPNLANIMYTFRSKMRSYPTVLNPYALPYLSYRYLQYFQNWPTIPAEQVTEKFISEISELSGPFFAWTHFMDLHAPINPGSVKKGGLSTSNRTLRHLLWDTARVGRVHEPRYDTMYDSALRYIDECIGSIVDQLKAQNQWDDTILIVTGDHGEVLFDRDGIYGHPRHHLYDDLLHVPLLVRVPDSDGERISTPFSLAWLHELIAEVLDIPPGDFPTDSGKDSVFDPIDETSAPVISDSIDKKGHTVAIRDERTKLISQAPASEDDVPDSWLDSDIAFEYILDKSERVPISGDEYPDLQDLAHELHTKPDELASIDGAFSEEVEQRLQDLGYRA